MKITLTVNDVDYDSILEQAIPLLREAAKTSDNLALKTVSAILGMPGDIPGHLLHTLPQETKDDLVVTVANLSSEKIRGWLQDTLAAKGVRATVGELKVEK